MFSFSCISPWPHSAMHQNDHNPVLDGLGKLSVYSFLLLKSKWMDGHGQGQEYFCKNA